MPGAPGLMSLAPNQPCAGWLLKAMDLQIAFQIGPASVEVLACQDKKQRVLLIYPEGNFGSLTSTVVLYEAAMYP